MSNLLAVRSTNDLATWWKELRPSQITEFIGQAAVALVVLAGAVFLLTELFYVIPFVMTAHHTHGVGVHAVTTKSRIFPGKDAVIWDVVFGWGAFIVSMFGLTALLKDREKRQRNRR